jgi:hypothetical protein
LSSVQIRARQNSDPPGIIRENSMQAPMDRDGHRSKGDQEPIHDAEADTTKLKWPGETHGFDWKRGCVYGFGVALVWLWYGFGMALGWLWTPEYMPTIWLCGGFGWLSAAFEPDSNVNVK